MKPRRSVDELDLAALGFADAAATGRPGYHPALLLKLYIYGYLNQVQSSRRLEREAGRNVELMCLTGKLAPDFNTVADFRRDHGAAMQAACRRYVLLCRNLGLIAGGTVAVNGSCMRAVNARDQNFTAVTIRRRMEQVNQSTHSSVAYSTASKLHQGPRRWITRLCRDR